MNQFLLLERMEVINNSTGQECFSCSECSRLIGVSERGAQRILKKLIKDGRLERRVLVGGNGGYQYRYFFVKKTGRGVGDLLGTIYHLLSR